MLLQFLVSLWHRLIPGLQLSELANKILVSGLVPDFIIRIVIRMMLWDTKRKWTTKTAEQQAQYKQDFVDELKRMPIAIVPEKANEQHYEVPVDFYRLCMGKRMKYSSALYTSPTATLDEADETMLNLYCQRAELKDGLRVLELGCGWGSFTLFAAERYPNSQFVGVSNSNSQREFITARAKQLGLSNVRIITCDINVFQIQDFKETEFDRIVSIEMFEHMKNYQKLFEKISAWLKPVTGRMFVHIFVHKDYPYHFQGDNWMAKYFFSGGTMPSDDLFFRFQDHLQIVGHWRVNGMSYSYTNRDYLRNMDRHAQEMKKNFANLYGATEVTRWWVMWRVFFMSLQELFGYDNGQLWFVSHYLFVRR